MQNKQQQHIIITQHSDAINTHDRGFNYGDGFFTTAKVVQGKVQLWALHRARLIECASRLAFIDIDFNALETAISKLIADSQRAVLKVVITRGEGGRGYGLPPAPCLTIVLSLADFPSHYDTLSKNGVSLSVSPVKLATQPLFAGLKTLNRLEQVMIKHAMQQQSSDDVLVVDYQGHVIETSAANIFAIKDGRVFSPQLEQCGIKGVYLTSLCAKLPIEFVKITCEQLKQMDAVFICNSLMAIIAITSIEDVTFEIDKSLSVLNGLLTKEFTC